MIYAFDRFLRYDELTNWLHDTAAAHPTLMAVESYGRSYEGRELWIATITDASTGTHDTKPAHWVDANIHSTELTASVAALALIQRLVDGHGTDETVTRALQRRTFYVVPRVNPDGAEWVLADSPQFRRSSVRPWPWRDAHRAPGLHARDIDGDGRILTMRVADPNGAWMESATDPRIMRAVPMEGAAADVRRYRLLDEGEVVDFDGFTVPTPRPPEGLDMNRNFPSGWGTGVTGSGDHPLSEPEIDALVRALVARPNVCGYNAYHTAGGVLLRPSSTQSDSALPPMDVWAWRQLGDRGTELTGYTVHSVFEDFTFDKSETMSGAADDWAYDHLGVFAWTTEFWDVVKTATGTKQSTHFWYTGPTEEEELGVLRWADEHHPEMCVDWYPFEHPQLGPVELGGWDYLCSWGNPPLGHLATEVQGHADFAIHQALAAPELEIVHTRVTPLGGDTWRVEAGLANTGWLATHVTERARKEHLVRPIVATLDGAEVLGGTARLELGQLAGRINSRFEHWNDGTPDRTLASWVVRGPAGAELTISATHQRAGTATRKVELGG
ncbi:MAG: M14 family metallopeptidase [Ilumatobacteraceae bacterium]